MNFFIKIFMINLLRRQDNSINPLKCVQIPNLSIILKSDTFIKSLSYKSDNLHLLKALRENDSWMSSPSVINSLIFRKPSSLKPSSHRLLASRERYFPITLNRAENFFYNRGRISHKIESKRYKQFYHGCQLLLLSV